MCILVCTNRNCRARIELVPLNDEANHGLSEYGEKDTVLGRVREINCPTCFKPMESFIE